jgi:hypothetical protein
MGNELPSNHQLFFPANGVNWLKLFLSSQAILSDPVRQDLVAITKKSVQSS